MLNGNKTVIKHKIGLLNLAEELGNVSKACRIMGLWPSFCNLTLGLKPFNGWFETA